jgi:succinate dehydrogenase/fumarate reductase iron-sulfur protein
VTAAPVRRLRVARGHTDGRPGYAVYEVPEGGRMTVLDALLHIHRRLDRGLAFRYACRAGMCGTCAVTVSGVPRLACSTRLSAVPGAVITVEPLRHFPVVRDLVVDMAPFFAAWRAVRPEFMPAPAAARAAPITPESRERRLIDRHRECISCGICYAACDVVGIHPGFLGPAAMTRALCLVADSRGAGRDERFRVLDAAGGCWRCHVHNTCAEVCPKGLDPTAAIAEVKRRLAGRALRRAAGLPAG